MKSQTPKFKVGDKIAHIDNPRDVIYIITKVRKVNAFECIDIEDHFPGLITEGIIDEWIVAHDDNYRVDQILIKYSNG